MQQNSQFLAKRRKILNSRGMGHIPEMVKKSPEGFDTFIIKLHFCPERIVKNQI
jgi:hypothetical protein